MDALINIIPLYIILFIFYGTRDIKGFLLLTGIIAIPLRIDYLLAGGGNHTGWTDGIYIMLSDISFIFLFLYLCFSKHRLFMPPSKFILPILCFIGACCLSLINTTAGMLTVYQVIKVSQVCFLYYFVLVNNIKSESELRSVVLFLTILLLFQGVFATMQFFTGRELDFFSTGILSHKFLTLTKESEIIRSFGTIGKPNAFGAFITPLLLINISILFITGSNKKLTSVAIIFGSLGLFFSFSRGAWMGFLISFIIYSFISFKYANVRFKHIFILSLTIVIIGFIFYDDFKIRFLSYNNLPALSRIPLMKIALNMIKEYPLFGVGANTFRNVIHSYTANVEYRYLHEVHNQYLLIFAEIGLIGFLTYLWIIISFLKGSYRCFRQKDNEFIRFLGLGLGLGFISSALHMMVDMFNSPILLANFFILGGLVTAAENILIKRKAIIHLGNQ